jgi:predicted metal-dependent hydrolase
VCDDGAVTSVPASRVIERPATILLPSGELAYTLRRSPRARRLRVVVDPRHGVVVTVPMRWRGGSASDAVSAFLVERDGWLRRHLDRHDDARRRAADPRSGLLFLGVPSRIHVESPDGHRRSTVIPAADEIVVRMGSAERREPDRVLEAWLREQARAAIDAHVRLHAPVLGVTASAVTLRDPRTRWGSASKTGRLSFSWRLILAPPEALETVVIHELAHLRVFGHGPAFWALVASRRPDHRAWRRWLREHAPELHLALAPG